MFSHRKDAKNRKQFQGSTSFLLVDPEASGRVSKLIKKWQPLPAGRQGLPFFLFSGNFISAGEEVFILVEE